MGRHRYNRHPTPDNPIVRYSQCKAPDPVTGQPPPPEFVRDDGTDNPIGVAP